LRGAYGLNAGTGTKASDSSGANHPGTISNPNWVDGKYGKALMITSGSQFDVANLSPRGAVTVSAWVKPVFGTDFGVISQHADDSVTSLRLFVADSLNRRPGAQMSGDNFNYPHGENALQPGTWTHLAATYDGSVYCLYVGGKLATCKSYSLGFSGTSHLRIGGGNIGDSALWVDEVRTYADSLTPQQIKAVMNTPIG
jgi:hypothetical protein